MRVVLVRHAEAVDGHQVGSDAVRYLTDAGRRAARQVGRTLGEHGVAPTRIYTSPLVRAVQTAEILAGAAELDGPVAVWSPLAGGTTAQALSILDEPSLGDDETVMLVGHEPSIRTMAGHLTGLGRFPGFRTAGACVIAYDSGRGSFQWVLDPRSLTVIDTVDDLYP